MTYPDTPQALTEALVGRWHNGQGLAFCPAHENTKTPALAIKAGTVLDIVWHCHAGCSQQDVTDALIDRGLFPAPVGAAAPRHPAVVRSRIPTPPNPYTAGRAAHCWNAGKPVDGTVAADYLIGRGLSGPWPETLRFVPCANHPFGPQQPAMIGRIDGLPHVGNLPVSAVHKTFTNPDAAPRKAMLGAALGGHVELVRGRDGVLVAAEGIENALSVAALGHAPGATLWAALTAAGLAALRLPRPPGHLIIAPDIDRNKQAAGQRAAFRLGRRAQAQGWIVQVLVGLQPDQDFNDALVASTAGQLKLVELIEFAEMMKVIKTEFTAKVKATE